MKAPSKLDQLRALREAGAQPVSAKSRAILEETTKQLGPALKRLADQPEAVPWLAPEGQCASCDKRRAQLQATMRKRRAKKP